VGLDRPLVRVVDTRADALLAVAAEALPVSGAPKAGRPDGMKDAVPDNAPGTEVPERTAAKGRDDRKPITRPDPDRVAQGDEAAEREKQRARDDVAEGDADREPAEPEDERADLMAERALDTRPSIQP
jgi:hypothetical protein